MEQIYKNHAQTVFRFLLSLTHDELAAEELTQETFYRAVKSYNRYNGECKVSVWLCQIAKHIWYQELAKNKKHSIGQLHSALPDSAAPPEAALVLAGDKAALYKAIHLLQEPMREVVYLRLSGEFSFSEIGDILGKSENWARVTFYRAKQTIAKGLTGEC